MGCVHTHRKILVIEKWGNPNHVWNVVEKTGEDNWKVGKTGWAINQTPTFEPKHDKIRTQWALDISLKNMLWKVWWCRCFEMEFWNWTICYSMSCSNGRRDAWAEHGRRWHFTLKCC